METRAAAKRKGGPGTSIGSNTEAAPPAAKRSRRGNQANPAQASAGGRPSSRSKGAKQTAPSNRNRNTPDILTTAAAASDQALPAAVPESEAPKPAQKEAAPTSAPAAAANPDYMDASGRRGSKGDPSSSGAEDDRVSGAKVFSCAAPSAAPAVRSLDWPCLLTVCVIRFFTGSWRRIWPQPGSSSWQVWLHAVPPCGLHSSNHHSCWLGMHHAYLGMHV